MLHDVEMSIRRSFSQSALAVAQKQKSNNRQNTETQDAAALSSIGC